MNRILSALLTVLALHVPIAASAQQEDPEWAACGAAGVGNPARQIEACTNILSRGERETSTNRALAFYNRGLVHGAGGNLDAEIADYNEAIRLNPSHAPAFNNRGIVHGDRGNLDTARSDLLEAVRLGRQEASSDLRDVEARIAALRPSASAAAAPAPALPSPSPAVSPTDRRVALVIGNSGYRNAPVLPNPRRDAEAMAGALRGLGFQSVTLHHDLDREGMVAALRAFELQAATADWAVVFFAGHGIELNGNNHLVPIDARLRSDGDVPDETMSLARILDRIKDARRLRMVILDACRDNPFLARMSRVATRSIGRGLAPLDDGQLDPGLLVAFAARAGQVAEDGSGSNSHFVQAMLKHMHEPGLELDLMFRRVRDDVQRSTARRQQPFTYGSLPGDSLSFHPR